MGLFPEASDDRKDLVLLDKLAHHLDCVRWRVVVIADQQLAGGFMWVGGDLIFLAAVLFVVAGWMRHEDRATARADARQDAEREEIRRREGVLAERLARERAQRP